MILVVGATGVMGRAVTTLLRAEGRAVRAATRRPETADDLRKLGAEVVYADLIDPPSLARACAGVEAVLAAAHWVRAPAGTPLQRSTVTVIAR